VANQIAYGFYHLKDRFSELVTDVGVRVVSDAIQATADEHNRQLGLAMTHFVRPVGADIKLRYRTAATARLMPLDENGRARPIKTLGHYDVAFPLSRAGIAWGANWLTREKMVIEEANRQALVLFMSDSNWMRDRIFGALFQSTAWTAEDDDYGALTISTLANGDATLYPYYSGSTFGATDNHFLAQAGAVADGGATNPFPTIRTKLKEHPENTGEVISFVPTNVVTAVMGLTTFIDAPDANITPAQTAQTLNNQGGLNNAPGRFLGYETSGVFVYEWPTLPDNYIISISTGAPQALGMREEALPQLRGFRQVATREDHPFWESQWFRSAGFGVYNRTAAHITRVGNGTYAPPTAYALPII
jgi:hypothetical protein